MPPHLQARNHLTRVAVVAAARQEVRVRLHAEGGEVAPCCHCRRRCRHGKLQPAQRVTWSPPAGGRPQAGGSQERTRRGHRTLPPPPPAHPVREEGEGGHPPPAACRPPHLRAVAALWEVRFRLHAEGGDVAPCYHHRRRRGHHGKLQSAQRVTWSPPAAAAS